MEYVIFIGVVIAVIVIAKLLSWPLKIISKLLLNIVIGIIMLAIINTFGEGIGLYIPFNMVTAVIAGLFGIPGVVLLIILNYIV